MLYTILYFNLIFYTVFLSRPLYNICFRNAHGNFPLVVITFWFFPYSWFSSGFVTRLTRRVPLVEQKLLTLPEHLSSPPVFSGIHVTQSSVLCVCFVDRCLFFCTFTFGHCVVFSSSIFGFWLPLSYLLIKCFHLKENNINFPTSYAISWLLHVFQLNLTLFYICFFHPTTQDFHSITRLYYNVFDILSIKGLFYKC